MAAGDKVGIIDGIHEMQGDNTVFEDLRFPFIGQQIDTSSGRIDYDYQENGIGFQANARYPEEPICMISQLSHAIKLGSALYPHIHWIQEQAAFPNWLMEYRIYNNGDTVPAVWTPAIIASHTYAWVAGALLQLSSFPVIDASALTLLSGFVDVRIYRDSTNASGLFGGADPVAAVVLAKEFDIHIELNTIGSKTETSKF